MKNIMNGLKCCLISLLILGLVGFGMIVGILTWLFS